MTRESTIWSEPDKLYVAKLRELAPSADQMTRTYQAKFSLPGVGDDVQLGMTATLTLSEHEQANASRVFHSRRCSTKARDRSCMSRTPRPERSRSSR